MRILRADKDSGFVQEILNRQHYVGQPKIEEPNEATENQEPKEPTAPPATSHQDQMIERMVEGMKHLNLNFTKMGRVSPGNRQHGYTSPAAQTYPQASKESYYTQGAPYTAGQNRPPQGPVPTQGIQGPPMGVYNLCKESGH